MTKRCQIFLIAGPLPSRPEDRQNAATIIRRLLVVAKSDRDRLSNHAVLPVRQETISEFSDDLLHRRIAVVINQHNPRMKHEYGTWFRPTPWFFFGHLHAVVIRSFEVAMPRAVDAG